MKIAVLSGKGGTGKTTISVNLAVSTNSNLYDTDVEEPNSHIFFNEKNLESISVNKNYPEVNLNLCNLCGKCGDFCNYNAIIPAKNTVLVFKESCHDCGGCKIICSQNAISYKEREIGKIHSSKTNFNLNLSYGELNIGELSGVKIINELKKSIPDEKISIIDCPPGTSCATVAAVEDVDYALIVAEATPFGISDMKMLVEMLREMNIDFSCIINKSIGENKELYEYCNIEKIKILEEIPFNIEIAKLNAEGKIFSNKMWSYKLIFKDILEKVIYLAKNGSDVND